MREFIVRKPLYAQKKWFCIFQNKKHFHSSTKISFHLQDDNETLIFTRKTCIFFEI